LKPTYFRQPELQLNIVWLKSVAVQNLTILRLHTAVPHQLELVFSLRPKRPSSTQPAAQHTQSMVEPT